MRIDPFYRRPTSGSTKIEFINETEDGDRFCPKQVSTAAGIPAQLSFDKIVANETRSPCSLRDFMIYCLCIEHSAENLQFYLWLREYSRRFHEAPASDRDLSPEWTADDQARALRQARASARSRPSVLSGSSFPPQRNIAAWRPVSDTRSVVSNATMFTDPSNPFDAHPISPILSRDTVRSSDFLLDIRSKNMSLAAESIITQTSKEESLYTGSLASSVADESFKSAGLSKPFTIQLFRQEIDQIIAIYLADGAPRETNLADTEKKAVLIALQKTTHPSAFRGPLAAVERSLQAQSHPNFIRFAIGNCRMPRRIFCYIIGIILLLCGIIFSILLTLSNVVRGWRAMGAIFFLAGVVYLHIAAKGMCPILYGQRHRQTVCPWEAFGEYKCGPVANAFALLDAHGGDGDLTWDVQRDKRSLFHKVFDRKAQIQDPALRWIQHQIALQAVLLAVAATSIFLVIFLAVPSGNMF